VVYLRLIRLLTRLSRFPEARATCEEWLEHRPNDQVVLGLRAELYERLGEETAAIDDYRRLVSLRPDDAGVKWRLASLLLYAKDLALRDPSAVEALLPDESRAEVLSEAEHRLRAHYYYAIGQLQRSAQEIGEVQSRDLLDWLLVSALRSKGLIQEAQDPNWKDLPEGVVPVPDWFFGGAPKAGAETAVENDGRQGEERTAPNEVRQGAGSTTDSNTDESGKGG
jgi:tetratricopeptide (TPR) repeat protein